MSLHEPPVLVLVVDDDFAVAAVHRAYLESMAEFTVVAEAHSAQQALRAAEELRPDLVLLDIHLPDMSGRQLERRAARQGTVRDQSKVDRLLSAPRLARERVRLERRPTPADLTRAD